VQNQQGGMNYGSPRIDEWYRLPAHGKTGTKGQLKLRPGDPKKRSAKMSANSLKNDCDGQSTKEGTRCSEALEKLRLRVDAEESAELVRIRKKLKLSQRRAAEIAGGGVNAFSRYENGKARPVAAVVNLFRLLDKHPELIDEITA
jgi:putative zinc finger/helix-turn-helix YgiT family protein